MNIDRHDERQDEQKDATNGGEAEKERKVPPARGTPGSFFQPTPRDEFMPRQGGRPTYQTAEVPLGTADVPEPPGGGGLPSRRRPEARRRSPSNPEVPEAPESSPEADEPRNRHEAPK
ncbi:hypothetical protein [Paraburkholderia sp. SIMBA_030]|uniref:hypothetical protein n=1 Tax=Paraburkholderia sp. SIMBA_030 TaxID=3085773 RepID=UPI00397B3A95